MRASISKNACRSRHYIFFGMPPLCRGKNLYSRPPPTTLKKSTQCFMFRKNDSPSQNEDIAGDGE
jgi:hypothetical protein